MKHIAALAKLDQNQADEPGDSRRKSRADLLIELASLAELWHDPEGRPWATIEVESHREHWPTHSAPFRNRLSRRYHQEVGGSPST